MKAQRGTGGHVSPNKKFSTAAGGKSGQRAVQVCASAIMGTSGSFQLICLSIRRTRSAVFATPAVSPAAALPPRYHAGQSPFTVCNLHFFQALYSFIVRWIVHALPPPSPAATSLEEICVPAIRLLLHVVFRHVNLQPPTYFRTQKSGVSATPYSSDTFHPLNRSPIFLRLVSRTLPASPRP
jgi:hypothetical protein